MKILFDQGTPAPLRRSLHGHVVNTAKERGWDRLRNGDLLHVAEREGYELLITTDKSMRHQQNLAGRRLAIVVLASGSWPYTESRIEDIRAAVAEAQPGELRDVPIPMKGEA